MTTMATSSRTRLRSRPRDSRMRPRGTLMMGLRLSELTECGFETGGEFFRRPASPVVEEENRRLRRSHVLVDRNDIDTVRPQRLQHRRNLVRQHGHVARYRRI